MTTTCGSKFSVRIPDAPSDQWETYVCIQEHDDAPFTPGIIHNDGAGTRWVEIPDREDTPSRTSLDDALEFVREIERINAVKRELKAAFARNELDGGVAAAPRHPLYIECEQRLAALREQLLMVF